MRPANAPRLCSGASRRLRRRAGVVGATAPGRRQSPAAAGCCDRRHRSAAVRPHKATPPPPQPSWRPPWPMWWGVGGGVNGHKRRVGWWVVGGFKGPSTVADGYRRRRRSSPMISDRPTVSETPPEIATRHLKSFSRKKLGKTR